MAHIGGQGNGDICWEMELVETQFNIYIMILQTVF